MNGMSTDDLQRLMVDWRAPEAGTFYQATAFDRQHVRRRRHDIVDHFEAGFPDYLRSVGIAEPYVAAANDTTWDRLIGMRTRAGASAACSIVTGSVRNAATQNGRRGCHSPSMPPSAGATTKPMPHTAPIDVLESRHAT